MNVFEPLAVAALLTVAPMSLHAEQAESDALIAGGVSALGPLDPLLQSVLQSSAPIAGEIVRSLPLCSGPWGFASLLNPTTTISTGDLT